MFFVVDMLRHWIIDVGSPAYQVINKINLNDHFDRYTLFFHTKFIDFLIRTAFNSWKVQIKSEHKRFVKTSIYIVVYKTEGYYKLEHLQYFYDMIDSMSFNYVYY